MTPEKRTKTLRILHEVKVDLMMQRAKSALAHAKTFDEFKAALDQLVKATRERNAQFSQ